MSKRRSRNRVGANSYAYREFDPSAFTEDEAYQLREWQERFDTEEGLRVQNDPAMLRLEFAKWLVAHEIVSEFPVAGPE